MNTARVYLEHPDLPGQGIRVHPSAVPTHCASGWRPAPEPEPEPHAGGLTEVPPTGVEVTLAAGEQVLRASDIAEAMDEHEVQPRRRRVARNNEGDEH